MALPSAAARAHTHTLGGARRKKGRKREKWGESGLAPLSGHGDGVGGAVEWLPSFLPSPRKERIRESWCARLRRGSRKLICAPFPRPPPSFLPSFLPSALPSFLPLPLPHLPPYGVRRSCSRALQTTPRLFQSMAGERGGREGEKKERRETELGLERRRRRRRWEGE